MAKLVKGQKIFFKSGNSTTETTVTKVGHKYFEVAEVWAKFRVEDMIRVVSLGYSTDRCYLSLQEIKDEKEYTSLREFMRTTFDHYGNQKFTLDQLRRIQAIVKEGEAAS